MLHDMIQMPNNGLTMVDMFCGAGIGAIGFKRAGFDIVDAFDIKKYAVDTYNLNIGNHARVLDARKINSGDLKEADIYVGGFPCQPFSIAGAMKGKNDERSGDMGYHFARIIKENMPNIFVGENVSGIISKRNLPFFNELISFLKDIGYNISWEKIDCYNYGVPQNRVRVFVVGFRKTFNKTFIFPYKFEKSKRKSIKDAIFDIQESTSIKNNIDYYDGGFSPRYLSRNRQRQWNEPSYTIVSEMRQLPLHPEPQNYDIRLGKENAPRRLNVRECLRIQTVPDEFFFEDSIPLSKQYERCSGIPSYFAYMLGKEIAKQFRDSNNWNLRLF